MTNAEYRAALLCASQISKELTLLLDEEGQDLFEAYGNVYEKIVQYECQNKSK